MKMVIRYGNCTVGNGLLKVLKSLTLRLMKMEKLYGLKLVKVWKQSLKRSFRFNKQEILMIELFVKFYLIAPWIIFFVLAFIFFRYGAKF